MELKEILNLIKENINIGLCYVGDNGYSLTDKNTILENEDLLSKKVKSLNLKTFLNENSTKTYLIIKLYR